MSATANPLPWSERAEALHRDHLVIDACCPILRDLRYAELWRQGGVSAGFATMALMGDGFESTARRIAGWYRQARQHQDTVLPAASVDDLRRAKQAGKLAVVLAFQNTSPFGDDLDTVELFHRLGVRAAILAYNRAELAADGCMELRDAGLSGFGRRLVAEMNRVGMLVDVSHCGERSAMEAIEASSAPVAITHTGAKAVHHHPRNVSDEQLRAVAQRGGFVGINAHPAFLRASTAAPPLEDVVEHLLHVADVAGIEHVGLGLDFSHGPEEEGGMSQARYAMLVQQGVWSEATLPPPPWTYPIPSPAQVPTLTELLLKRGLAEREIVGVLGENFARVLTEVWGS